MEWLKSAGILSVVMAAIIIAFSVIHFLDMFYEEVTTVVPGIVLLAFGGGTMAAGICIRKFHQWAWFYLIIVSGLGFTSFMFALITRSGHRLSPEQSVIQFAVFVLLSILLLALVVANPWKWKEMAEKGKPGASLPNQTTGYNDLTAAGGSGEGNTLMKCDQCQLEWSAPPDQCPKCSRSHSS